MSGSTVISALAVGVGAFAHAAISSNTAASCGTITLWSRSTDARSAGKLRVTSSLIGSLLIVSAVRDISASGDAWRGPAVGPGDRELPPTTLAQPVHLLLHRRVTEDPLRRFTAAIPS